MKLNEFRKGPHLSVSAIGDYIDCSLHYKFSRVDRIPMSKIPAAMELGSCIHDVLAEFNQERMQWYIMSLKEMEDLFELNWTTRVENNPLIKFKINKNFEDIMEDGKNLIRVFRENFEDVNRDVIAIEEPFRLTIEELSIPIVGVMDLLEEDESEEIIITDYKTTGRSYSEMEVDRNFQLTIYYMAARANGYANKKISLKIDNLIKTKTPRFEQYYTERESRDEIEAIKKINIIWKSIQYGFFVPNEKSWKCKDCSYQQECFEWYKS